MQQKIRLIHHKVDIKVELKVELLLPVSYVDYILNR